VLATVVLSVPYRRGMLPKILSFLLKNNPINRHERSESDGVSIVGPSEPLMFGLDEPPLFSEKGEGHLSKREAGS